MTYPNVPVGNQWVHPTLENDPDMHAKTDTRLNQLRSFMVGLPGSANPRLRVALRPASPLALTSGAAIPFGTVLEDTGGGWNATTRTYLFPATGVYLVAGQVIQSSAVSFRVYLTGLDGLIDASQNLNSYACAAASGIGARLGPVPIRVQAANFVRVSLNVIGTGVSAAADDGTTEQSWLTIIGVGEV